MPGVVETLKMLAHSYPNPNPNYTPLFSMHSWLSVFRYYSFRWHYIESLPKSGISMSITFWYRVSSLNRFCYSSENHQTSEDNSLRTNFCYMFVSSHKSLATCVIHPALFTLFVSRRGDTSCNLCSAAKNYI